MSSPLIARSQTSKSVRRHYRYTPKQYNVRMGSGKHKSTEARYKLLGEGKNQTLDLE